MVALVAVQRSAGQIDRKMMTCRMCGACVLLILFVMGVLLLLLVVVVVVVVVVADSSCVCILYTFSRAMLTLLLIADVPVCCSLSARAVRFGTSDSQRQQ